MRDNSGFKVMDNGCWHQVYNYDVESKLRNMNTEQLKKFLAAGCLVRAKKLSNGDFALRTHIPGNGDGPITGLIAYWATKTVCYGTAVAGAGAVVVATGGTAGAVTGALVTATTAGASTGATIVGGTIAGYGATASAAELTATVIGTAGSIGTAVAAVESASMAVGGFFALIPFLP